MRQLFTSFVFCTVTIVTALPLLAADSLRTQEITTCLPGEIVTWGDGRDRPAGTALLKITYNPENAPGWISTEQVVSMITKAANSWSQCDIPIQMFSWHSTLAKQRDVVVVKWDEKGSMGNFGLANLKSRTLSIGPNAFNMLRTKNPKHDAGETLQMVISHEMGHFFGLMAHSRRCIDVVSYYNNGKGDVCYSRDPLWNRKGVDYRSILPTACDIERCRNVNSKPPL